MGLAENTHIMEQLDVIVLINGNKHGFCLFEITNISKFNIPIANNFTYFEDILCGFHEAVDNVVARKTGIVDKLDEVSGSFCNSSMEECLAEVFGLEVMETEFPAMIVLLMVFSCSRKLGKSTHVGRLKGFSGHNCVSFDSQSSGGLVVAVL